MDSENSAGPTSSRRATPAGAPICASPTISWFASPPAPPPAEGPSLFALAAVIGTLAFLFVVAHVLDVYDSAKPITATADRFAAAAAAADSAPPAYPSWWPRRLKLPSDGTFALLCAFWGALALNFKQMSLYLAPAIFCYLLAGCLRAATKTAAALRVARLGAVVLATTALCWAPFLGSWADARAVLVRVFPVGRHLYEDKVASVWCTLALTPLKLKNLLSIPTLVRLTLGVTLGALGPPCAMLLARPSRAGFLLGATACALAFFLFSFQVHEKHVLLPLLPAALLAPRCPTAFGWLAAVASFSMYPMLKRDGDPWSLRLPYAVTQLLFTALSLDPAAFGLPAPPAAAQLPTPLRWPLRASLAGMAALHAADLLMAPPARYPDLHAALFAAYACVHLGCAYLAALYAQWRLAATEPPHTPFDDARADVPLLSGAKEE